MDKKPSHANDEHSKANVDSEGSKAERIALEKEGERQGEIKGGRANKRAKNQENKKKKKRRPQNKQANRQRRFTKEFNRLDPEEKKSLIDSSPLMSHFLELRERVLKSVLIIVFFVIILFYFANDIYQIVAMPLIAQLPQGSNMIATGVVSPFLAPFKLSVVVSFFAAMPFILFQLWAYIAPGLYRREKRIVFPIMLLSVVLFYGGIAFAYFLVFPAVMSFLMNVGPSGVQVMPDISDYLGVALKLFFAFGLAFEIPVATILLVWSGAVSVQTLKAQRAYVLIGCFVVGMLLTPPDVVSQIMLAIPMWMLFELGILLSQVIGARSKSVEPTQL